MAMVGALSMSRHRTKLVELAEERPDAAQEQDVARGHGRARSPTIARAHDGLLIVLCVATPIAVFLGFFHWQILIPTRFTWLLQGDWGAHVIGWNAFRHDDWRWPLGSTRLLASPTGATVTYTDSNPLLCLLLKPFAALLPTPFQFTGLWLLSCILLQFAAAWMLLRPHVPDRWLRLIGAALFTLTPTLLNRMGHADLCAHWLILLALHLFINVRNKVRRDLGYAAVLTASALVHPYLLLMVAAIWASDVLRRGARAMSAEGLAGLLVLAARSAAVAAAPLAALWATGALSGYQGDAGGFGFYSMALDALYNPGRAGVSRLLPTAPQGDGQYFEGFQYLGAGLLVAVLAAAATLATSAGRARLRRMGWLAWLAPALVVLLALALSDHVQLHGHAVGRLSYKWIPFHLTSTFRSSGRLFWPCAYVLILVSLLLAFALRPRLALAIGAAALALQVVDLTAFDHLLRANTAEAAGAQRWLETSSRKWDRLVAAATLVEFEPPDPHADDKAFYEIAWRATSMRRPVNIMYTARVNPQQQAFEAAARDRFMAGQLDPGRLYVLTDGCAPAGGDPARLRLVNRLTIIPPKTVEAALTMRPAPIAAPFPLGATVSLDTDAQHFRCMLGGDWSGPEPWGVWSNGPQPRLWLRLAAQPQTDLTMTFRAQAFPVDGQGITVLLAGQPVARMVLRGEPSEHAVRLPARLLAGTVLDLTFKVDRPQSPAALSGADDVRQLGIGLRSVRLDDAPSPPSLPGRPAAPPTE